MGKGSPYLVCTASLCWLLSEATAARGAGWPLGKEALPAAALSVLGFSEVGKFGMVPQTKVSLKVSVASEELSFLWSEGC